MLSVTRILLGIFVTCAITPNAYGWSRGPISDQTVVERAELIVVGRILADSIKRIDLPPRFGGYGYEHYAMLEIIETLKGSAKAATIEVIIHYGLDPVTGRYLNTKSDYFDNRQGMPDAARNAIEIYDRGGMGGRISGDLREPHIWMLRHSDGSNRFKESVNAPGIWDPQDIQPQSRKPELAKFVSTKAEQKWMQAMPQPTPASLLWMIGLVMLMLGLIAFLRRRRS